MASRTNHEQRVHRTYHFELRVEQTKIGQKTLNPSLLSCSCSFCRIVFCSVFADIRWNTVSIVLFYCQTEQIATKRTFATTRGTQLGEFSTSGRLLLINSILINQLINYSIGRIFAYRAIVYFRQVFFDGISRGINFDKNALGFLMGEIFTKLSSHPGNDLLKKPQRVFRKLSLNFHGKRYRFSVTFKASVTFCTAFGNFLQFSGTFLACQKVVQ
jgi:hypothetical protein